MGWDWTLAVWVQGCLNHHLNKYVWWQYYHLVAVNSITFTFHHLLQTDSSYRWYGSQNVLFFHSVRSVRLDYAEPRFPNHVSRPKNHDGILNSSWSHWKVTWVVSRFRGSQVADWTKSPVFRCPNWVILFEVCRMRETAVHNISSLHSLQWSLPLSLWLVGT